MGLKIPIGPQREGFYEDLTGVVLVVIFNPSLNEDYSRKWQKNQK